MHAVLPCQAAAGGPVRSLLTMGCLVVVSVRAAAVAASQAQAHLHCPDDVVDWESGQQVHSKPAAQVAPRDGSVVCDKVSRCLVLRFQSTAVQRSGPCHSHCRAGASSRVPHGSDQLAWTTTAHNSRSEQGEVQDTQVRQHTLQDYANGPVPCALLATPSPSTCALNSSPAVAHACQGFAACLSLSSHTESPTP